MGRLFGTDGVRGLANEKLNCELVYKLGQASARVLSLAQYKPRILVGRDTRLSGDMNNRFEYIVYILFTPYPTVFLDNIHIIP